jgi:hypothetical protein
MEGGDTTLDEVLNESFADSILNELAEIYLDSTFVQSWVDTKHRELRSYLGKHTYLEVLNSSRNTQGHKSCRIYQIPRGIVGVVIIFVARLAT